MTAEEEKILVGMGDAFSIKVITSEQLGNDRVVVLRFRNAGDLFKVGGFVATMKSQLSMPPTVKNKVSTKTKKQNG